MIHVGWARRGFAVAGAPFRRTDSGVDFDWAGRRSGHESTLHTTTRCQVEKAWAEGRAAGKGNKPRDRDTYTDQTLQLMYERGYFRGRQEALQDRFGDAATTAT